MIRRAYEFVADDLEKLFLLHYQVIRSQTGILVNIWRDVGRYFSKNDLGIKKNVIRRYFLGWTIASFLFSFLYFALPGGWPDGTSFPVGEAEAHLAIGVTALFFYAAVSFDIYFFLFALAAGLCLHGLPLYYDAGQFFHPVFTAFFLAMYLFSRFAGR